MQAAPIPEPGPKSVPIAESESPFEGVPESASMAAVVAASANSSRASTPVHDSMSLDAVRNSITEIDAEDLDVPAFMRKRM
jgi:hypothetical protein